MLSLIWRVIRERDSVQCAMDLVDSIKSTTGDGKLLREESSIIQKEFWALVRTIREKNG